MALLDERGRLFGRFNLIDAIVAVVVLGLIPLAYGAFLVFRPPLPTITQIKPAEVFEHQQATLHITGADLRPFLNIKVGDEGTFGFLVAKPTEGEVVVYDLPAGTYDLVLLDRGQELLRKPNALKVLAVNEEANQIAPSNTNAASHVVTLQAVGRFIGLARDAAGLIRSGVKFDLAPPSPNRAPLIEVLSTRAIEPATRRVQTGDYRTLLVPLAGEYAVPAVVRLRCVIGDATCKIGETTIAAKTALVLAVRDVGEDVAKKLEDVRFAIDEVRLRDRSTVLPPADQKGKATVRVRFVASIEMADQIRVGDLEIPGSGAFDDEDQARVVAIAPERQPITVTVPGSVAHYPQEMVAFTVTLDVPVVFLAPGPTSDAGWMYRGRGVRIGTSFPFQTLTGFMTGTVVGVQVQ